jgi:integral membrane protein (TIGR01906 family)
VRTPLSRAADVWIALATALAIVALTIPLFLNPIWVGFEQGRAQATAWTGFSETDLRAATDSILSDLVFGPPDFDVDAAGVPVLEERERAHMRDVRAVFVGFFVVAAIMALVAIVVGVMRREGDRLATWRAIRAGAIGLVATLVVAGIVAVVAFDALFEIFHRLLFAGGSYTFDPRTDRLVQLFPFQFWQETAIAVGVVAIVAALIVAALARRRLTAAATPAPQAAPPTFERSRP